MAKYIIDIPDDSDTKYTYDQDTKELKFPSPRIDFTNLMGLEIVLKNVIPYTEPDRKAIEDEVWKFAKYCCDIMDYEWQLDTYQQAKGKIEAWKKQEDEIHVGDEIEQLTATGNPVGLKCVATKIVDDEILKGVTQTGEVVTCSSQIKRWWRKTGRHFDEIEELLKKMRNADD